MDLDAQDTPFNDGQTKLEAWAAAHKLDANLAGEQAMLWLPAQIMMLAASGSPSVTPILRRGLLSQNGMIQVASAQGLAELRDKESVQAIIDTCNGRKGSLAAAIAEALVYFDDKKAQDTVDRWIPKEHADDLRLGKAQGRKPFS